MTVKLNYIRPITAYAWHVSKDRAMVCSNKGCAWCPVIFSGKATALPACLLAQGTIIAQPRGSIENLKMPRSKQIKELLSHNL